MGQRGVERKTNPELIALVAALREKARDADAPVWRDIAKRMERPARLWAEVNVGKLERVVGDGETAIVPGKVLSSGQVARPIRVAAFRFSEKAREKITAAGGECLRLDELAAANRAGAQCRIVG